MEEKEKTLISNVVTKTFLIYKWAHLYLYNKHQHLSVDWKGEPNKGNGMLYYSNDVARNTIRGEKHIEEIHSEWLNRSYSTR